MTSTQSNVLTAVVTGLLVALAFVAWPETQSPDRRHINLGGRAVQAPFSDGVLVGDTLYLAGRIGIDPETRRPPERVEDEVRMLLDGMQAVLAEADMTMDDIVSLQVHSPDLTLYDRFNAVYRTYFGDDLPARAFIGSGPLLFGGHFEAMAIAVGR